MITLDNIRRIALDDAADFLVHSFPFINSVDLVIQLGSGQDCEDIFDHEWDRLPLREMPHLPVEESIAHHRLEIVWGTVGEFKVLIFSGRFHLYEGYGRIPCMLPIWAAAACGARNFLFSNAAVGLKSGMARGEFMVFADHFNNLGVSALEGHQHLLESPFVDMSATYDRRLTQSFLAAAQAESMPIHEGIYMANIGPQFETPAELRFAAMCGADAIGMSTVLEATTAHALRARVVGVSMIKHAVASDCRRAIAHNETFEISCAGNKALIATIRRWLLHEAVGIL